MKNYKLTDFDAVLAISRRGSFRAAALDMGMSTSALSNAISKLEGQLGVRLFNRTTRSVSLTEAGHRFVDQVSPAVRDIHQALDTVRSQQETPSGTVRINTFVTAAQEILEPLILEFLKRFPQVQVDLVTEGSLVDIVADGFDFGVRSKTLVPSDMIAIPLGPARRHAVVAAPSYFANRDVPRVPADLKAHTCIRVRLPNGALYRWQFESEGQPVHVDVDGPLTLDEASLARAAVLDGVGIGYFMESNVREDIAAGRLVRILDDWTPPVAPLCLYYPSRRNPPAAFKVFVDLARELARSARAV
ncbi:LysR family transcriptional regulator [Roseovarius atlanticus]|uniref:LysR family transcriptional regulator n=1 Tax=Roseovarius atlanticus TaxID=1641875 RepID=UPI001C982AA6|nr:LysR family transcriptional regulator [Roseovarius atlanticus]MBY5987808.1 LysR family transcriptional regulator [Roseovarius atlanticus]MBY6123199.1 LysR family transcriptional regulator [Roseovarius atlanticus]MBY6147695.1 LysR family transcriptional regulator [Roseovarius atlanticus]